MNERDAMTLLAKANPVREQDLTPLDLPDRFARRRPNRRLVIAIVVAAIAAGAMSAAYALGGFNHGRPARAGVGDIPRVRPRVHHRAEGPLVGPTGAAGPSGLNGPTGNSGPTGSVGPGNEGPGFSMGFLHRGDGTLESFGVSVWEFQKTGFQIEVRYLGPRGDYLRGGYRVVYRRTVPAASMSPTSGSVGVGPSGRNGPGPTAWTWSGRFTPSQWNDGCRSGDYEIDLDYGAAGSFSGQSSSDSFRCTGD